MQNAFAQIILKMEKHDPGHGEIGARLRAARIKKGLSQFDAAIKADMRPATVSRYESGDIQNPGSEAVGKLAELYEVSVDWLYHGEEPPSSSGTRQRMDTSIRGFFEFKEESPLAKDATPEEIESLLTYIPPPGQRPTRWFYEKLLLDMRSELEPDERARKPTVRQRKARAK